MSRLTLEDLTLEQWSQVATIGTLIGLLFAFWQIVVNRGQLSTMKSELALLGTQVQDLLEGRQGKIFKLKRAVRSLYDACQNVPSPPDIDKEELFNFNLSKLSAIEASCDTFFFREITAVPGLREVLEKLDTAALDAQDDILALTKIKDAIPHDDLIACAKQLQEVYRLAGQCDEMLVKIV